MADIGREPLTPRSGRARHGITFNRFRGEKLHRLSAMTDNRTISCINNTVDSGVIRFFNSDPLGQSENTMIRSRLVTIANTTVILCLR